MAVKKLNTTLKFDDYADLHRTFDYDKAKATRLAEAMTEVATLEKRLAYLKEVLTENSNLAPFLWKTAEGDVIALHDLEDDHLKNIIGHITRNGGMVKAEIVAEARSRGINPDEHKAAAIRITARAWDDEDEDEAY